MQQWALVTGASAGIGAELAKVFAERGISVALVARRRARLESLASELVKGRSGLRAEVIEQDLALRDGCANVMAHLESKGIALDYLVNNAGFGASGIYHELPLERQLEMIDLNVRALAELTHRVLPTMVRRGSGRILNVGSVAGFMPGPYMATYYAGKAFVNSFSQALAEELQGTGVTVTVLAPGPVATEFNEVANPGKTLRLFSSGVASAEDVARHGFDAMMKGERVAVHSLKFKTMVEALRFAPRILPPKIAARLNRSRL